MSTDVPTYELTLTPLQTLILGCVLQLPSLPLALAEPPAEADEEAVNAALDQLVAQDYARRPAHDTLTLSATVVSILQRVSSASTMLTISAFRDWETQEARFHIASDLIVMQSQDQKGVLHLAALRDDDVLRETLSDLAPLPQEVPGPSAMTVTQADIQAAFGLAPEEAAPESADRSNQNSPAHQLDDKMAVARLDLYTRGDQAQPGQWQLARRLAWLTSRDRLWRAADDNGSEQTLSLVPASGAEIAASWEELVSAATEAYTPYKAPARKVTDHA